VGREVDDTKALALAAKNSRERRVIPAIDRMHGELGPRELLRSRDDSPVGSPEVIDHHRLVAGGMKLDGRVRSDESPSARDHDFARCRHAA
jgi:hypothetical protein